MKLTLKPLFESLRARLFWTVDAIKGNPIKTHLIEITNILRNFETNQEQQEHNLKNLLKHSTETTAFYKNLKASDFNLFPVINKNTVNENHNAFQSNLFTKQKLITRSTSGSTGTPFKIRHNKNKISRNSADNIYFSELAGFKIGYQLWYLRYWGLNFKNSNFKNWAQNLKPVEVINLNKQRIAQLIKEIKRNSGHKGWLGFPSAFEEICKYLDETKSEPIDANFKSIIGMAESINDYTKERMLYYFKCPMVSRYSNMENGIIAQQNKNENNFTINWASYNIEILNLNNDEHAPKGSLGRIVITDLFNYAMPLIRYDTGDIGSIDYSVTPPVFSKIEGRKTDTIYNTKGQIVSSFIMINSVRFKGIKQIQLIQEGKIEYIIKLNTSNTFTDEEGLIEKFKSFLGEDAIIKIQVVNEIPLLSSGKRKMTINNYVNQI